DAATRARDEMGQQGIPFIGLAKREEQIVIKKDASVVNLKTNVLQKLGGFTTESDDFVLVNVPHNTNLVKLLQRIRDESHRFAVSYHSTLKRKRQTKSVLDDIPGIGPATRKKLIRLLGSAQAVRQTSQEELSGIVGPVKAAAIHNYLAL
ncbi:MAG TPA: excinuclease ABC subunit UvrC, partial [Candidatus Saccharimonadales bacterium]|nr:excinuclease ABC subunit UvrC [Candidatus Saccharimonadales bacterium]